MFPVGLAHPPQRTPTYPVRGSGDGGQKKRVVGRTEVHSTAMPWNRPPPIGLSPGPQGGAASGSLATENRALSAGIARLSGHLGWVD